jgi:hypothetical protein
MSITTVSSLRQRMIEDMNLRNLAPRTQQAYIRGCRKLATFLRRSPDTATAEDIRLFLTPAAVPETPGLTDVAGWRAASEQSPTRHGSRTRKGPENPGQTLLLPKMCAERARN